jgi:ADP-heptose:LPS heptosyltransferase
VSEPREILVVRALALGDLLCAVPLLRALRRRFPDARIGLVGLPWASSFVDRFERDVDALVPFPGWPGIREVPYDARRTERFVAALRRRPPDLAIQAHGSGRAMNGFVAALGGRETAGFHLPDDPSTRPIPGRWVPYPADVPEVHRLLRLGAALGADADDDRLEWPLRAEDERDLAAAIAPDRLEPGRYAVVHPGASRPVARWPAARFAAVADALAERGLDVVLTGSGAEAAVTRDVSAAMGGPALDVAGRTSLGALGALLAGARLVVANDTGVAHLAEAVGTPTIRVFRASDPRRWGPVRAERHVALVPSDLGARCVDHAEPGHPDCRVARCVARGADPAPSRSLVPVGAAVAAVDRLLVSAEGRRPHALAR